MEEERGKRARFVAVGGGRAYNLRGVQVLRQYPLPLQSASRTQTVSPLNYASWRIKNALIQETMEKSWLYP